MPLHERAGGIGRLERAGTAAAAVAENILAVALILAVFLNFANVVGRYLFATTIRGGDEVEIYILIWTAFLGAVVVSWRRQHLRMDVLIRACPRRLRRIAAVAELVVTLAVSVFVASQSVAYVMLIFRIDARSDIAGIPTWIAHVAVTVGFVLMAAIAALRGSALLFGVGGEADAQDAAPPTPVEQPRS